MHWHEYLIGFADIVRSINPGSLYALRVTLSTARKEGRTVFTCGNGGSFSNAQHLAQDLQKGTMVPGEPDLKTYHLGGNPSSLTAWANDDGYIVVFSADLEERGQQGDVLIAISGSGNSPNVLNAVNMAHELEMRTWGVTGFNGGHLKNLAHRFVHVQSDDMGMVEAAHGVVFHWLVEALKECVPETTPNEVGAWCPGVEAR